MKKILIIEDEISISKVLSEKFKSEKFSVLTAKNGKEGLETALKEHPTIIILDIVMPVMDGITMLKKLREDSWGKTAKVIILTNLSDSESVSTSIEKGVYDYLTKSNWKLSDLIKIVKERIKE